MSGLSKRTAWLPWTLVVFLAFIATDLSYQKYHFDLLRDSFLQRDRYQQQELDHVQAHEAALQKRLSDTLSEFKVVTLASMLKDSPQAVAAVAWDGIAQRGILKPSNLPAARSDQDYQLWLVDSDYPHPVSAGVFDPGKATRFQPAHPIAKVDEFAISLERKGGAPAPQAPFVLVGQ